MNNKIVLEIPDIYGNYNKKNYKNMSDISGIYAIYSDSKQLLYIGKANNVRLRLKSHFEGKTNTVSYHKEFSYVEVYHIDDKMMLDIMEIFIINALKPKYNQVSNYYKENEGKNVLSNSKQINATLIKREETETIQRRGCETIINEYGMKITRPYIKEETMQEMFEFFQKAGVISLKVEIEKIFIELVGRRSTEIESNFIIDKLPKEIKVLINEKGCNNKETVNKILDWVRVNIKKIVDS